MNIILVDEAFDIEKVVTFALVTAVMATVFALLAFVSSKHIRYSDTMHDLGVCSISVSLVAAAIIGAYAAATNLEYLRLDCIESRDVVLVGSIAMTYFSIILVLSCSGRKNRERERELGRLVRAMDRRCEQLCNSRNR